MKEINREMLQTFVAKKRKALSTKTVRNLVALLSTQANGDNRGGVSDSENTSLITLCLTRQGTCGSVGTHRSKVDLFPSAASP